MVQGDVLPDAEAAALRERLSSAIGPGASVALALSALEPHGQQWWVAVYLWCVSARAADGEADLLEAATNWAEDHRRRDSRERPVYIQTVDRDGMPLRSVLVRRTVRPRPIAGRRPRPRPQLLR